MASRGLGSLTLDLLAKIGGFTGPLSQAERELDRRASAMSKRAKGLESAITGSLKTVGAAVLGFAAAFVSVQAVFNAFNDAIARADKLDELSARLGISTEKLSEWGYAAQLSGSSLDSIATTIPKLSKVIAEAGDASSKAGELFKAMGVDARDASGRMRDVEDVLPEVADKFKELQNDTLEQALAMELFGKSGAELLEFLNRGKSGLEQFAERAKALGIVIDDDTSAAAAGFRDKLDDLVVVFQGLAAQAIPALLPELTKLVERLIALTTDGERTQKLVKDLSTVISGAATVFELAAGTVGTMISQLAALKTVGEGVINLDWSRVAEGLGMGLSAQGQISANWKRALAGGSSVARQGVPGVDFMDVSLGAPLTPQEQSALERRLTNVLSTGSGGSKKKTGKSEAEKEAERLKAAYDRMNESLAQQIALFGKDGEAAKVRYEVEHGELVKLSQAQKDGLIIQAEKLDMMREEEDVQKRLNEVNKRREEVVSSLLEDLAFERDLLGQSADQQEILNNLRYAGVEANSAYGQSIIDATTSLQEQRKVVEAQIEIMDAFRTGLGDALVDIATGAKSAKEAFKDFLDDLTRRLTQMIIQRLIERAFGQQGTTGQGGSGGGDWGWVGQAVGAIFGGGKAAGGPVNRGMFYEVNENGPELLSVGGRDFLMMGQNSGQVSPSTRSVGSGASTTNIYVQGTATRETMRQIDRANGQRTTREMARTGSRR